MMASAIYEQYLPSSPSSRFSLIHGCLLLEASLARPDRHGNFGGGPKLLTKKPKLCEGPLKGPLVKTHDGDFECFLMVKYKKLHYKLLDS